MNARRRKIYLTFIAIGMVCLVIDRLFILQKGGEKSARRSIVKSSVVQAGGVAAGSSETVERWNAPKLNAIPDSWRKLQVEDEQSVRDPFVASVALAPEPDEPEKTTETQPAEPEASFADRHAVEAIMVTPAGPQAIVDGRVVKVGMVVDGYRIARIEASAVVLVGDDEEVMLELPKIQLHP